MGETTAMRQRVFRSGYNDICRSIRKQRSPSLQLGLSREFLQETALEVYSEHVQELLEVAQRPNSNIKDFDVCFWM